MKKVVTVVLSLMLVGSMLTGCGSGTEISRLNSIQSLNSESETDDFSLSLSEEQSMVYAQVSERSLLDLSTLESCSDTELQQVVTYMDGVNSQLTGETKAKEGVIDSKFTNYLLSEFEKTPYYWQRLQTKVRGIDSSSRSIVVDVVYSTIGFAKEQQEDSLIIAGEPDYQKKLGVRYNRWIELLTSKYRGGSGSNDKSYTELYNEFKKVYGDPGKILKSQRQLDLTDDIHETRNQKTYSGVIDSAIERQGATMTVRYVLVPKYAMGVNLGLTCKHLYVVDYSLEADPTEGLELFQEDGYTTVSNNVFKLVDSYFKCIDECDLNGLYKQTYRFDKLDKYYQDLFSTTYTKHNNYTVSLFNISGTKITCGIQISSKVRAKGSNMTYPVYTDRYYAELQLVDDKLQFTNMVLLSRKLEGEPAISTSDADDTGFVASVDLSNNSKRQIEELICKFSNLQLLKDNSSNNFMSVVDYSISDNKLNYLKENMNSLSGEKKVVWLQTYQNGTSNYASVKCKELFQKKEGGITDATVSYEFISKGSKWYIYGYDILSAVQLDTNSLTTANSLCTVTASKVEEYNSQVEKSNGDTNSEKSDELKDGVVYTHKMVLPKTNNSSTKAFSKVTADTIVKGQYLAFLEGQQADGGIKLHLDDIESFDKEKGYKSTDANSMIAMLKRVAAYKINKDNKKLSESEAKIELGNIKTKLSELKQTWGVSDIANNFERVVNTV